MKPTIGQRILAAVVAHQLDIGTDRALKLYVQGRKIDHTWELVGEQLLKDSLEADDMLSGVAHS